jgi:hypothetical protein
MAVSTPSGGSLGSFNVGLAAALGLIYPLGISFEGLAAQIDALLSIGLGPFQAELSLQFNAALAAQATLTLQIGDPTAALQLALSALAQLQAALTAALAFPPINISISAELSAAVALGAALAARLGLIKIAIEFALKIKLAGLKLLLDTLNAAAALEAQIALPGAYAFDFDDDGGTDDLATIGGQIQTLFNGGVGTIAPTDMGVYGIVLMTKVPAVQAALSAIITV